MILNHNLQATKVEGQQAIFMFLQTTFSCEGLLGQKSKHMGRVINSSNQKWCTKAFREYIDGAKLYFSASWLIFLFFHHLSLIKLLQVYFFINSKYFF